MAGPDGAGRQSDLHSQVLHLAWEWRLELALVLGALTTLRLADQIAGAGGAVLVAGLVAVAWWRSPALQHRVRRSLRHARRTRRIRGALRVCSPARPLGKPPAIRSLEPVDVGLRVTVRLPAGQHTGDLEHAAEALAAALRVREVRVTRDRADASLVDLLLVQRDPFGGPGVPWPMRTASAMSLWQPVPLGTDEEGQPVALTLPEHNLLLGGEPGAGKSVALSLLVAAAALDPSATLTLLDGKQVELAAWQGCAARFVGPDMTEAADALEELRRHMDGRYQRLLAAGRRKLEAGADEGLHLVVVDELAFYLRGGKADVRNRVSEALRDLVSRGRAAGIVVVAATQKPSHDVVPTWIRDLFSFRLALRCTTPEASDTVLGQGWASQGYSAGAIDPATRGVGYLLHEGGLPIRLRCYHLDDEAVAELARRAEALRSAP